MILNGELFKEAPLKSRKIQEHQLFKIMYYKVHNIKCNDKYVCPIWNKLYFIEKYKEDLRMTGLTSN